MIDRVHMATILVSAERSVDAPAGAVYGYIADMRGHHPHFLPPAFSDFQVESGGVGEGHDHPVHGDSWRPPPASTG